MKTLLLEALLLKDVDRAGWKRVGVSHPESVAAHSWGMAWLVMVLAPPHINRLRAMELAIVHDLAEARVGDITPHDGIHPEEKRRRETAAIEALLAQRPDLLDIWREYDERRTPESLFVHDIDRLDMALQANHYAQNHGIDTVEFLDSASRSVHHKEVAELINSLRP